MPSATSRRRASRSSSRPIQPDRIRQAYAKELLAVAKSAHALVRAADFPALAEEHAERTDDGPVDEPRDETGKWTSEGGVSAGLTLAIPKGAEAAVKKSDPGKAQSYNKAIRALGGDSAAANEMAEDWVDSSTAHGALVLRGEVIKATAKESEIRTRVAAEVKQATASAKHDPESDATMLASIEAATRGNAMTLKAMATLSQAAYESPTVTLYRGVSSTADRLRVEAASSKDGRVEVTTGVASCWSEDRGVATKFASTDRMHPGVVLEVRVPKEAIVMSYRAIPALRGKQEKEVVIATRGKLKVSVAGIHDLNHRSDARERPVIYVDEDWLRKLRKDAGRRQDRASPAQRVAELLAAAKYAILQHFPLWKIERVLRKFAARTSVHQKQQFLRQVEGAIGIPLDSLLDRGLAKTTDEFVADNVALITSIPEQYFAQVQQVVLGGMKSGMRAQEMAGLIEDRFGVSKSRAKLIARDQIGKFNVELDRKRKLNVGIKREKWHTMEDERVRPTHAELDDFEYDIDDPPEGDDGPAYLDINCRCWREALFDEERADAGPERK